MGSPGLCKHIKTLCGSLSVYWFGAQVDIKANDEHFTFIRLKAFGENVSNAEIFCGSRENIGFGEKMLVTAQCFLSLYYTNTDFDSLPFPKQALVFTCLQYKSFENFVGKGEIARNEQFLLFPQCFFALLYNFPPFSSNLKLSSSNSFSLEETKICCLGKG